MDLDRGLVNLILLALVLLAGLVRWLLHRVREARGEKVEGPPPSEPMLPYEDVVEEVFGPYIRRRQQQKEAAGGEEAPAPVEIVEEAREAPPAPRPPTPHPPPGAPPAEHPAAPSLSVGAAVPSPAAPFRPTLEERLLTRPGWGMAARLVVAAEVLGSPRVFRPHGPRRLR